MRQAVTSSLVFLGLCVGLVACGPSDRPPRFDNLEDQEVSVGDDLVIDLRASDPDGDVLAFSFSAPSIPDILTRTNPATIKALGTDGSMGRFTWKPIATDVGEWKIDFEVSDGELTITEAVTITVKPEVGQNQQPTFVEPGGGSIDLTIDPRGTNCVDVQLKVEDPDSTQVTIKQEPMVYDGMRLEDNHNKTADFHWCPTETQLAAQSRYRANFSANDGVSPNATKILLINFVRPPMPGCPGAPPSITHQSTDIRTIDPIKITAQISDDKGLKSGSEPLLYFATKAPPSPTDLSDANTWTAVTAVLTSGSMTSGTWEATVENPVASKPADTSATLYYVWVAKDNDDTMGDCDHTTQAPATGSYSMKVTSSGVQGNQAVCTSCSADEQCGGLTDNCLPIDSGNFCAKACTGDEGCPQPDYKCSAEELKSVDGTMARQCIPRDGSCTTDPPSCTDDNFEPNDNLTMAKAGTMLSSATDYSLKVCPSDGGTADEDYFKIVVAADAEVTVKTTGGTDTDLDMQLVDDTNTAVGLPSASNGSNETITRCLTPGTYYVRIYSGASTAKDMAYGLSYTSVAKSCAPVVCVDDSAEPDDDKTAAKQLFVQQLDEMKDEAKGRQICADDEDWFKVYLFPDDKLRVSLTFTQTVDEEDLDLHIHDMNGVDLIPYPDEPSCLDPEPGQSCDSNEYLEWTVGTEGFFFVHVDGYNGAENKYDICVSIYAGQCPVVE